MTPAQQDAKLIADMNAPTEPQVERAAKLIACACGDGIEMWENHKPAARAILTVMANQSAIMVGVFG
jgi:hypothetical protein